MSKIKINNKDELDVAMKSFINRYLSENPIYDKLKLTEEQMMVLIAEEVMPKFKAEFEYESRVMKQWFKS